MTFMQHDAYQKACQFLFEQLPMFQRVGAKAYKNDLTNIKALMERLGQPERQFPSLHIGGTNGKGSVTHMLTAICQAAGLRTGLYVSPHYKDFRERIRINGQYIPRSEVVEFVQKVRPLMEDIRPSFFEISVAMAFSYFAKKKVDMAVVEVGLGGRLDSTNIIQPELAVITNISFDHVQFLGDTYALIAGEKAGIIKKGIPVVVGETLPETAPVFEQKAVEMDAAIYFADQHYSVELLRTSLTHSWYRVMRDGELVYDELALNATGPYQHLNLQTTLAAVDQWQQHTGRDFSAEAIRYALANLRALTRFQGRWQPLREQPLVIADSAHNEAGLQMALTAVDQMPHNQLHIVFGMVNDKDREKVWPLLPATARYYWVKANVPRGLDAGELAAEAAEKGLQGKAYSSVRNGYRAALRAAADQDLILICGSIFVTAEVL